LLQPHQPFTIPLPPKACDISLTLEHPKGAVCLSLFGTQVGIDFSDNRLYFMQSVIPLEPADRFTLRLISDKCTLELYVNGGRAYACNEHRTDYRCSLLHLSATSETSIAELTLHPFRSIWGEKK
jgi:hypothetical protein